MERLQASQSPYSRSHNRRLKRKEKGQLVTGMDDLGAALDEIEPSADSAFEDQPGITSARRREDRDTVKQRVKPGQIGEGKGATLSKAQRKRAL